MDSGPPGRNRHSTRRGPFKVPSLRCPFGVVVDLLFDDGERLLSLGDLLGDVGALGRFEVSGPAHLQRSRIDARARVRVAGGLLLGGSGHGFSNDQC